jgi:hypothetical protein
MGKLIVTCKLCDEEIIRIPGINVEYPPIREKANAQLVIAAAAAHLVDEHREEAVAHLDEKDVFWRTTLE